MTKVKGFGFSLIANLTLLVSVLFSIGAFDHIFFVVGAWFESKFGIKAI